MKLMKCKKNGCVNLIKESQIDIYCSEHKDCAKESYRKYKKARSDKEQQAFYSSKKWRDKRKEVFNHDFGLCINCLVNKRNGVKADVVHHIVELKENENMKLDNSNLICLCNSCHAYIHTKYRLKKDREIMQDKLRKINEDFNKQYYNK